MKASEDVRIFAENRRVPDCPLEPGKVMSVRYRGDTDISIIVKVLDDSVTVLKSTTSPARRRLPDDHLTLLSDHVSVFPVPARRAAARRRRSRRRIPGGFAARNRPKPKASGGLPPGIGKPQLYGIPRAGFSVVRSGNSKKGENVAMNVAAVVIIAAAVFAVLRKRKNVPEPETSPETVPQPGDGDDSTEFIGGEKGGTALLFSAGQAFDVVLTDKDDPEKIFTARVGDVVIGRSREKADIVTDYDKSVSKEHCRIFEDDGKIFVQDMDSVNRIYVDDRLAGG